MTKIIIVKKQNEERWKVQSSSSGRLLQCWQGTSNQLSPDSEHLPSHSRVGLALSRVLNRLHTVLPAHIFIYAPAHEKDTQIIESASVLDSTPHWTRRSVMEGQVRKRVTPKECENASIQQDSGREPITFPRCSTGEQTRLTPFASNRCPQLSQLQPAGPICSIVLWLNWKCMCKQQAEEGTARIRWDLFTKTLTGPIMGTFFGTSFLFLELNGVVSLGSFTH